MTHFLRFGDVAAILAVIWALAVVTPLSWWGYVPGEVNVADAPEGTAPPMGFEAEIRRDIRMSYQVIARALPGLSVACDASSNPFTYRRATQPPKGFDLAWWAPGDDRCARLPAGEYTLETCWTARELLAGLLPKKTVCRTSNVFTIRSEAQ